MRVRLLVVGGEPVGLSASLLAALPAPFEAGGVELIELPPGCYVSDRAQVDAPALLTALPAATPGSLLLGATGLDLFMAPLAYVFGLSELGSGRGLVSWSRLAPETSGAEGAGVLRRRLLTESVHELGHALGLVHCVVPDCAMHRSLWPEAVDLKQPLLCGACMENVADRLNG